MIDEWRERNSRCDPILNAMDGNVNPACAAVNQAIDPVPKPEPDSPFVRRAITRPPTGLCPAFSFISAFLPLGLMVIMPYGIITVA